MTLHKHNPRYIPWMNIILGQSFSTRSVIPQFVIVTPTRFLDFNTRTYDDRNLGVMRGCVTMLCFFQSKSFHSDNLESVNQVFSLGQTVQKGGNLSFLARTGLAVGRDGFLLYLHMVILDHRVTGAGRLICRSLSFHGMTWLGFGNFYEKKNLNCILLCFLPQSVLSHI